MYEEADEYVVPELSDVEMEQQVGEIMDFITI